MARPKFPHFTLEESEVMEEFIKRKVLVGSYSFDVKLESKKLQEVDIRDPVLRSMWFNLTAKRIDALCDTGKAIHIIEVKRVMLPSGIGQLYLYKYMYENQFKPNKPIVLWLIAKYKDPDIVDYCNKYGIKTWWLV